MLDEGFEVTRVSLNLESVEVENISSDIVEETRVVWRQKKLRQEGLERIRVRSTHGKR